MSYLKLSKEKQMVVYEKLSKNLTVLHFEPFPLERRRKENQSIRLSAPTKKRQIETEKCVGWRKYYEGGYFIEVLPTFNEESQMFSQRGIASVLVKSPSKKKGFKKNLELYFQRNGSMVEKINGLVNLLNEALKNIPYGKDGKLMELTREGYNFYFVSRDGTEKVKLNGSRFFKLLGDSPNLKIVQTIFKSRKYYHDNKPEGTVPIQKIKKKRRVKNPEGAVPAVA